MYKQREIVLVPFPCSGLSAFKRRPALIISGNGYRNVLVCVTTGNRFKEGYSVMLLDSDREPGTLSQQPVTNCHKPFTVEPSQMRKRFSVVKEQKREDVQNTGIGLRQTSR